MFIEAPQQEVEPRLKISSDVHLRMYSLWEYEPRVLFPDAGRGQVIVCVDRNLQGSLVIHERVGVPYRFGYDETHVTFLAVPLRALQETEMRVSNDLV